MKPAALVVAAHGFGDGSLTNVWVDRLAARAAELCGLSEWRSAFHRGTPHFSQAMTGLQAERVVVVPLMTAQGYYSRVVLPRELNPEGREIEVTEPVGTSPWLAELVQTEIGLLCEKLGFVPERTSVLVIGHGTPRHPQSRESTEKLVEALRHGPNLEVKASLMDEAPYPREARDSLAGEFQILLPFLIGPGDHASEDLPVRLGTPLGLSGRTYLAPPIGHHRWLAELIAERATGRQPVFQSKGDTSWCIS